MLIPQPSYLASLVRKINGYRVAAYRRYSETRISGEEFGERIKIYDLVCPLRYDILVRANFIALLAENNALSANDLNKLLEFRAAREYKVWHKEVEVRRGFPEMYNDENRIGEHFRKRVDNVQKLWESMSSRGFDPSHPILLESGRLIREVNGKTFGTSIFAGDGCHRIACIFVMGKEFLEPNEYEIALRAELIPRDNTSILLEKLPISMPDYLTFISRGYCAGRTIGSKEEALQDVQKHNPHRLIELKQVLQNDTIYEEHSAQHDRT